MLNEGELKDGLLHFLVNNFLRKINTYSTPSLNNNKEKPNSNNIEKIKFIAEEMLKNLLTTNIDINKINGKGYTVIDLLFKFAKLAKIEIAYRAIIQITILLLADKRLDPNINQQVNSPLICHAIELKEKTAMELLIAKGANLDCKNEQGNTPLHLAARCADLSLLEELLLKVSESHFYVENVEGYNPLHIACVDGEVDHLRLLVQHEKVNVKQVSQANIKLWHLVFNSNKGKEVTAEKKQKLTLLIENQAAYGAYEELTPYQQAVKLGYEPAMIVRLAERDFDYINPETNENFLHRCFLIFYQQAQILELFLKKQQNNLFNLINQKSKKLGVTPLHLAAISEYHLDLLKRLLILPNIDVHALNDLLFSPFSYAIYGNNLLGAKELINAKPDREFLLQSVQQFIFTEASNKTFTQSAIAFFQEASISEMINWDYIGFGNGQSFLHLAVKSNSLLWAQHLIQLNPDLVNFIDIHGQTPLHLAVHGGNEEVLRLLLHNTKPNFLIQNNRGESILHLAVLYRKRSIIELLLAQPSMDLCLNLINQNGEKPYQLADPKSNEGWVTALIPKEMLRNNLNNLDKNISQPLVLNKKKKNKKKNNKINDIAKRKESLLPVNPQSLQGEEFFSLFTTSCKSKLPFVKKSMEYLSDLIEKAEIKDQKHQLITISYRDWCQGKKEKADDCHPCMPLLIQLSNNLFSQQERSECLSFNGVYIAGSVVVRELLGLESLKSSDLDIVVVDIDPDKLYEVLVNYQNDYNFIVYNQVYPCRLLKINFDRYSGKLPIDILCISSDSFISHLKDRDFTINDILIDITRNQLVGFKQSFKDLIQCKLRCIINPAESFTVNFNRKVRALYCFQKLKDHGGYIEKATMAQLASTQIILAHHADLRLIFSLRASLIKLFIKQGLVVGLNNLIKSKLLPQLALNRSQSSHLLSQTEFNFFGRSNNKDKEMYNYFLLPLINSLQNLINENKEIDFKIWYEQNRDNLYSLIDTLLKINNIIQPIFFHLSYRLITSLLMASPELGGRLEEKLRDETNDRRLR